MGKNTNDHESLTGIATGVAPQALGTAPSAKAGEAEASGEDISALGPEALVAALDVPATTKQAAAEVTKRLESTPMANRFAYRVLRGWSREEAGRLTAKEAADLDDAVDGLRRVCFRAIGSLYVPGDRPPIVYDREIDQLVTTDRENTAIFLEDKILEALGPYRYLTEQELLILGLNGEFKNIPRATRLDLIDLVRKQYTKKAQALNFLSFDTTPALLNAGVPESSGNTERAIALLTLHQEELAASIGADNYQNLPVAVDFAQDDSCADSKQSRKSGLTAAIARFRDVGMRQASYHKKKLHIATTSQLQDENSTLFEIFEVLRPRKENPLLRRRHPAYQEGEASAYFPDEEIDPLEKSESVPEEDESAAVLAEIPE